jgi:hypothetical protein
MPIRMRSERFSAAPQKAGYGSQGIVAVSWVPNANCSNVSSERLKMVSAKQI